MATSMKHVCVTDATDFSNAIFIPLGQTSFREPTASSIMLPHVPLTLPDMRGQRLALSFFIATLSLGHNFQEILFDGRMNE